MKRLLVLFISAASLFPYAGAGSLEFMNMDVGGASASMGGTGAAAYGTLDGLSKNPAALASLPSMFNLSGAYSFYVSSMLWSGAFGFRFDNGITLALGGKGVIYDAVGAGIPYESGYSTNLGAIDVAGVAGVGVPVGELMSLPFGIDAGATAGYAYEGLDDVSISAMTISLGTTFWFMKRTVGVGFAVKNLGFGGSFLAGVPLDSIPLAAEYIFGAALNLELSPEFGFGVRADTDLASFNGAMPTIRAGAEIMIVRMFFVRAGGVFADHQFDMTAGGGAMLPLAGTTLTVDYSFLTATGIGMRHAIALSWSFGGTSKPVLKKDAGPYKPTTDEEFFR